MSPPLRIGLVCPYSLSLPGGVQGQVLGLARALRHRGHDVRIIAPTDGPVNDPGVVSVGTTILNPSNGSVAPLAPDPPAQLRTLRALRDDFDVLHVHEPLCPGPTVTAVVVHPAPVVATFHAAGDQPAYRYLGWLARAIARRIEVLVAVSEDAKNLASTALEGTWTVLFNGVEVDSFDVAPWPRTTGRRVVLFVGRHEERKGLGVLLAAVRQLPSDVEVWVAGTGPQTEELRARYPDDRILWLGRIDDEERNRRMVAADVFCAPSIGGESFGVILLEAMAAGTPVVASDISGYVRVAGGLDEEPAALLPPAGDVRLLAADLRAVLDDPELASRLVAAGRRRADRFSMARLAAAYEELYAQAMRSRAGVRS